MVESILNLSELKTEWPPEIEVLFNMYRVAVFFWILIGLVWLSGVISLVTEAIKTKGKSFGSEFSKPQKYTNKINNAKVIGWTQTFVGTKSELFHFGLELPVTLFKFKCLPFRKRF